MLFDFMMRSGYKTGKMRERREIIKIEKRKADILTYLIHL